MSFQSVFKKKIGVLEFTLSHGKEYSTPISLNYNWSYGALAGLFLLIQVISGVFLSFFYSPITEQAFDSISIIVKDIHYGWLMRYTHSNGASFFFIFMYAHMFRSIFYKTFQRPNQYIWWSGLGLLILSIVVAFLGYVLPWAQMSFWAATVITNLLTVVPFFGDRLVKWVWGGFALEMTTLRRFYSLHYILAILLCVLVVMHLALLHRAGSSDPLGVITPKEKIPFNKFFTLKDLSIFFLAMTAFSFVVCFHPDLFNHPDNYIKADKMVTPSHIVPEWYFLPFYAILRSVDSKFFGVILMVLSILALFTVPSFKRKIKNASFMGHVGFKKNIFFYLISVSVLLLGIIGSWPVHPIFIFYGRFFTVIYFLSFLIEYKLSRDEEKEIGKSTKDDDEDNFKIDPFCDENHEFRHGRQWKNYRDLYGVADLPKDIEPRDIRSNGKHVWPPFYF